MDAHEVLLTTYQPSIIKAPVKVWWASESQACWADRDFEEEAVRCDWSKNIAPEAYMKSRRGQPLHHDASPLS